MADAVNHEHEWREYEKEFLVRWFYGVAKVWQPRDEVAVLKCVTRFQAVHHARYPTRPPRSKEAIVQKLCDLKAEYKRFSLFICLPGIRFDQKHNTVRVGELYWVHTWDRECHEYWRYRKYGMFDYEERQFLFDGGCLDAIDYKWLADAAAGIDPRRMGSAFA